MTADLASSLGLLAATASAAAAYGVRVVRRGAAHHARIERAGTSPLLGKAPMEMGYWVAGPLARLCIALRIGADAVTWTSLALAGAAALALAFGHFGLGALASVGSFACDALDGLIARETGTASEAGEVLDATIDRYAEMLFFGGILFHERGDAVVFVLALAAMAGAVMVSYATAKAEALNVAAPRGAMRRQERAVYLVLGTACVPLAGAVAGRLALPDWIGVLPLTLSLGLVALVGNASAVRRLRSVARATRDRERSLRQVGDPRRAVRGAHVATGSAVR